jgi:AraC family L-rhamnose operon regulatory protein RhaS
MVLCISGTFGMVEAMLVAEAISPVSVLFPAEGVFVLESRHKKGFLMPEVAHDYWKFLLIFRGSGALLEGARRQAIAAGDVIIVPPRCRHQLRDSANHPLSLYAVCVQTAFLGRTPLPFGASGRITLYYRPIWVGDFANLLRSLLIEQSSPASGSSALITGLTWQIIGMLWRANTRKASSHSTITPGALARRRMAAYIQNLPRDFDRETNLDGAARRVGLGRRRFTQLFREMTGKSWLQTLQRLRIEHARRLLQETQHSVAGVAFETGFSDLSHFYRVFRRACSASPEKWRLKIRARNEMADARKRGAVL